MKYTANHQIKRILLVMPQKPQCGSKLKMTRGEIWWIDFGIPTGSVAGYRRPGIIVQNNDFNESNINTVVVIPLTSNLILADYAPNVLLSKKETSLSKDSVAVIPLVGAVDKSCLLEKVSTISNDLLNLFE